MSEGFGMISENEENGRCRAAAQLQPGVMLHGIASLNQEMRANRIQRSSDRSIRREFKPPICQLRQATEGGRAAEFLPSKLQSQ